MGEFNIKTISIDKENFYNIEGRINLDKRSIQFNVSIEDLKSFFDVDIDKLLYESENEIEKFNNIYLYDENNISYSCIGCIFSIRKRDSVKFITTTINIILENTISNLTDMMTNKVIFKTNYLGKPVHGAYIKGYSFLYDATKKVIVDTYYNDNFNIDITVESKKEYSYSKLSKIVYTYIEMLFLIFGDMPTIKEVILLNENEFIKVYFNVADKYNPIYRRREGMGILGTITEESVNKVNMRKFEKFRKCTKIIYDLLMININSEGYTEIKNCNLVQIMEGMYRTITGTEENLYLILGHYFSDYPSSKRILTKRDKRKVRDHNNTPIFIYKAKNHRNYLSHLNINQNKNVFYKLENQYAYWKLCMCIRVYILEFLEIDYMRDEVKRYIEKIEKWAKKNGIRFSSKLNS